MKMKVPAVLGTCGLVDQSYIYYTTAIDTKIRRGKLLLKAF